MISHGCMIGPPAAAGKGIQIVGRVPIIGERRIGDVTDGLIHRWRLTENANDAVGALNLTNNNSVTFSSNGASFDSLNWLSTTLSRTAPISMSIWATSSEVQPASQRGIMGFADESYNIATLLSIQSYYSGYSGSSRGVLCYYPGGSFVAVEPLTGLPQNVRTLLCVTWDGATITIRTWDGTTKRNKSASKSTASFDSHFALGQLGAYAGGTNYRFRGTLIDARVYSRALTSDEFDALASNGPNP